MRQQTFHSEGDSTCSNGSKRLIGTQVLTHSSCACPTNTQRHLQNILFTYWFICYCKQACYRIIRPKMQHWATSVCQLFPLYSFPCSKTESLGENG